MARNMPTKHSVTAISNYFQTDEFLCTLTGVSYDCLFVVFLLLLCCCCLFVCQIVCLIVCIWQATFFMFFKASLQIKNNASPIKAFSVFQQRPYSHVQAEAKRIMGMQKEHTWFFKQDIMSDETESYLAIAVTVNV